MPSPLQIAPLLTTNEKAWEPAPKSTRSSRMSAITTPYGSPGYGRSTDINLRDSLHREGGSRTSPTGEWVRESRVFVIATLGVERGPCGRGMPSPLQW